MRQNSVEYIYVLFNYLYVFFNASSSEEDYEEITLGDYEKQVNSNYQLWNAMCVCAIIIA